MVKSLRVVIYSCVLMLAAGIGFVIAGFILGGNKALIFDYKNFKFLSSEGKYEKAAVQLDSFDEISIDISDASVVIEEGDKAALEYSVNTEKKPEVKNENGKLVISYKEKSSSVVKINMLGFSDGSNEKYFKLTIPKGTKIKSTDIKNDSGSLKIEGLDSIKLTVNVDSGSSKLKDVTSDEITVSSDSGSIKLENITSDKMIVSSDSGSIKFEKITSEEMIISSESGSTKLENVTSEKIDVKSDSASIGLEDIKTDNLKLSCDSGSISAKDLECNSADVKNQSGSVKLSLEGEKDDYSFDIKSKSGSIYVGSDKADSSYTSGSGDKKVKVSCDSGSVKIEFE